MELVPYVKILLYSLLVILVGAGQLILGYLLGPKRNSANKLTTFECGVDPSEADSRKPFNLHFYVIATFFILFDIEAVFIIPWAFVYRDLSPDLMILALVDMGIFMAILAVGLLYVLKKKVHLMDEETSKPRPAEANS